MTSHERIFVTSVETAAYQTVDYFLGDDQWRTRFAAVATGRLARLRGARCWVLVTPAARSSYAGLAQELVEAGLAPRDLVVAEGRTEDEILSIFAAFQERIPAGATITLDVTFTLRHLPFVYLASLVYLAGLRSVHIDGIYYGAYELRDGDRVPLLEITALFDLIQWYHALEAAREAGDWSPVARRLRLEIGRLFRRSLADRELSRLLQPVQRLADALSMGLPIEAGLRAAELGRALSELNLASRSSAVRLAVDALRSQLPAWAVSLLPSKKQALPLNRDEFGRQLDVAAFYLPHGHHQKVLAVMREFLVSALLLAAGPTERWLDYNHRKPFEDLANALAERARAGVAGEQERNFASLWRAIADRRNELAHAGITEQEGSLSAEKIEELLSRCRCLLDGDSLSTLSRQDESLLLVTPVCPREFCIPLSCIPSRIAC